MSADLTVTGDDKLVRQLQGILDEVRGQHLHDALVVGGLLVANDAKIHAPYETGNYRRSIHVGGEGVDGNTTGTDIGGAVTTEDSAEIKVGSNVEYARRLELGFVGTDALGRSYHQPARPHLRPALESQKDDVNRDVGAALVDLIRAGIR